MTQITGTYSTYDAKGQREDLSDIIYNISENYWNGKTSLQLEIKAIRYSNVKD